MTGENSLLEWETLLELWASSRERADPFSRLVANFYSLKTKFLLEGWYQVIG